MPWPSALSEVPNHITIGINYVVQCAKSRSAVANPKYSYHILALMSTVSGCLCADWLFSVCLSCGPIY